MKELVSSKSLATKLLLTIVIGFSLMVSFTIYNRYTSMLGMSVEGELKQLRAISTTTMMQIDVQMFDSLCALYNKPDAISKSGQNILYYTIHTVLKKAKELNKISTDIYILLYDSLMAKKNQTPFYFTVTSGENPYYLHPYYTFPKELSSIFSTGGTMGPFEDEHGTWLSAGTPLIRANGSTAGLLMVDKKYDEFLKIIRIKILKELVLSLFFFGLVFSFIVYFIKKITKIDNIQKEKIINSKKEIELKNKKIIESITYAQRIQTSIVPAEKQLIDEMGNAFMFYLAKDVISGDFPWIYRKKDTIYIAAVDCTGHGVPGAMMSFIGYFLLNEINSHQDDYKPAYILDKLDEKVKNTLKQENGNANSRDGMDLALCKIDKEKNSLEFAGAHRPLLLIRNNEILEFKADRKPIGGITLKKYPQNFTNHVINIESGDAIYIYSDGITDQFGGNDEKKAKYGSGRIKELILRNNGIPMNKMKELFENDFIEWKGNEKQFDDILLIGIKF